MAVLNKFRNFLFTIMFQLTRRSKKCRINTYRMYKTFYIRSNRWQIRSSGMRKGPADFGKHRETVWR